MFSEAIEAAARGLQGTVLPSLKGDPEINAAQDARGTELAKKLVIGGAALGGGVGLSVVLANYLKSLKEEQEIDDESNLNDDTMYIHAPTRKSASDSSTPAGNRWLAPGLGLAGGVLAAGGAYTLTQMLYNKIQEKRLKDMLDEAQQEALVAAKIEQEKVASDAKFTVADLLTAGPVAIPLLTALASGGIAYAALDKSFPVITAPKSKYPRRIRAVAADGTIEKSEDLEKEVAQQRMEEIHMGARNGLEADDAIKVASCFSDRRCARAERELLYTTVSAVSDARLEETVTSNVLGAVARHGIQQVKQAYYDLPIDQFLERIEGEHAPSDFCKMAAAAVIASDEMLSPFLTKIAAAEFQDQLPNIMRLSESMNDARRDVAVAVGVLINESQIKPDLLKRASTEELPDSVMNELSNKLDIENGHDEKEGLENIAEDAAIAEGEDTAVSDLPEGSPEQLALLQAQQSNDPGSHISAKADGALTSDVGGSLAEEAEGDQDTEGNNADEESQKADDIVDTFMDDPKNTTLE